MNFDPMELLKNAQMMQDKMAEMQSKLTTVTVVGSAGGGMVRVFLNGQFELLKIEIEPEAVDPNDIPMLQDLIKAAFTDASQRIRDEIRSQLSSVTGGLQLPPGMMGF